MAVGFALAGMLLGAFAHADHDDGVPPAAPADAAFTSHGRLPELAGREGSCPACLHLQRTAGSDFEPLIDLSRPAFAAASLSPVISLPQSEALSRTGGRAPPFRA